MIQFTSKIFSMNMANDHEICHACVLLCRLLACFVGKEEKRVRLPNSHKLPLNHR